MKISELLQKLETAQNDYGDLQVQVLAIDYSDRYTSKKWHGTVSKIQQSPDYPDQLEIITTA